MISVPKPDSDPIYRRELLAMMQAKIDEHPRSAQVQIGPSEVGGCPRKVAFKLAYGGDSDREGGWAAHRGTLIHAWLDEVFKGAQRFMPDGSQRFFSDMRLEPVSDHINGGTLDLYDRLTETVIDHKCPGDFTVKAVRGGKWSEAYFIQTQVYGMHLEAMGYPVSRVALFILPACGDDLHSVAKGAILATWPYDRQVALDAVAAIDRIKNMLAVAPVSKVLEIMPIRSDFCSSCACWSGSGDRRAICPGADVRSAPPPSSNNPFAK